MFGVSQNLHPSVGKKLPAEILAPGGEEADSVQVLTARSSGRLACPSIAASSSLFFIGQRVSEMRCKKVYRDRDGADGRNSVNSAGDGGAANYTGAVLIPADEPADFDDVQQFHYTTSFRHRRSAV